MPKKIYDIIPPRRVSIVINTPRKSKAKKSGYQLKNNFQLKEFLISGGIFLVLLLGYLAYKLPQAKVEIIPQTENINLKTQFTASTSVKEIDIDKELIPAQYKEVQKSGEQEFPASGRAVSEGKTSGNIIVYNKNNPATSMTLRAGTHFLSDSGKYFVTLEKVVVPAPQKKTPGSIAVKVEAQESGEDYNIGPSQFSVPKLSGTTYYYSIWAESKSPMAGGFKGKIKTITQDDISQAKDTLTQKLIQQAKMELRGNISPDDILIDDSVAQEVLNAESSAAVNSASDTFIQKAQVKVSAIIFSKKDAQNLAKSVIISQLPQGKTLGQKLELSYNAGPADATKGKLAVDLQISAPTHYNIDIEGLKGLILKKTPEQVKEVIAGKYGNKISQVRVTLWPFWVTSVPKNHNRTTIKVVSEE